MGVNQQFLIMGGFGRKRQLLNFWLTKMSRLWMIVSFSIDKDKIKNPGGYTDWNWRCGGRIDNEKFFWTY